MDVKVEHNIESSTSLYAKNLKPIVPETIPCKIKDKNAYLDI